jgi:hypothetical protein
VAGGAKTPKSAMNISAPRNFTVNRLVLASGFLSCCSASPRHSNDVSFPSWLARSLGPTVRPICSRIRPGNGVLGDYNWPGRSCRNRGKATQTSRSSRMQGLPRRALGVRRPSAPVICWAARPPAAESKRTATGTASEMTTNRDAMLTFEHAPKSRTPKF